MTSEVIVMNQKALVLAADSAVTVTTNDGNTQTEKYYKSANKIFELSSDEPVAIMLYNSVSFHAAPWEIIIKNYRKTIKGRSFSSTREYLDDFLSHTAGLNSLFSISMQEDLFRGIVRYVIFKVLRQIEQLPSVVGEIDVAKKDMARQIEFLTEEARLSSIALPPHCAPILLYHQISALRNKIEAEIESELVSSGFPYDKSRITDLGINGLLKEYKIHLSNTGLFVAGYGSNDFFPSFEHCRVYGLILGILIYDYENGEKISLDVSARVRGFAQTDMVNTFLFGIGDDLWAETLTQAARALQAFDNEIQAGFPNLPDRSSVRQTHVTNFKDNLLSASVNLHLTPLQQAAARLAPDEMASLAETLVSLESLKERVTKPSEQVGGPVDVAVLTRSEGLVWVKRKHYFPSDLNARFFERQRRNMT